MGTVADVTARERASLQARADPFAGAIGRRVRLSRAKRAMTRRQLAQQSGASERYLAQIESGQGNPSVIMLKSLADALEVPIMELIPRSNGHTLAHISDLLGRLPQAELPSIAELIERRVCAGDAPER